MATPRHAAFSCKKKSGLICEHHHSNALFSLKISNFTSRNFAIAAERRNACVEKKVADAPHLLSLPFAIILCSMGVSVAQEFNPFACVHDIYLF
jgi:hypothetical protein